MTCLWLMCKTDMEKPSFIEQLRDTQVSEGSGLYLSCSFTGQPKPHVQWLKNNMSVLPSDIYMVCSHYDIIS